MAAALQGCFLIDRIGGAFKGPPEALESRLSAGATALIEQAFADIKPSELRDHHVHVVGLGTGDSGASVNPKMMSWRHPTHRARALVYLSAAGITDETKADNQYVDRLVRLIRTVEGHGKSYLLAFDRHYRPDGTIDAERSNFYTPNEYVVRLSEAHPDLFLPAISVHPYRPDWRQELEKWALRGARLIKWLPNAQGMDPADPKLDGYYAMMKRYDMTLLSHAGEEQAVEAGDFQELGNPLRLRRPLDQGVRVIVAHAASLGDNDDLDNPGSRAASFDLFMRMMDNPKYEGLLFGEISAMLQFNRFPDPILTLMRRKDLHHRLVNGSDYPVPAVNFLINTGDMVDNGMITEEEQGYLKEIYPYNPLLFDYVAKRTLRVPETGKRLPGHVFTRDPAAKAE